MQTSCVKCSKRARIELGRHKIYDQNAFYFFYLKRYLSPAELSEIDANVTIDDTLSRDCGCRRPHVNISVRSSKIIFDVSSVIGLSQISGIQNYVFGVLSCDVARNSLDLVVNNSYGFEEILPTALTPLKNTMKKRHTKLVLISTKFLKKLLHNFWLRYFRSITKIMSANCLTSLVFSILTSHLLTPKNLVYFQNSILWIPDNNFSYTTYSRSLFVKKIGNNSLCVSLHDLLPLFSPDFFADETNREYHNFIRILNLSDLISCQSNVVCDSAKDFFKIRSHYFSDEKFTKEIKLHRRPLKSKFLDFNKPASDHFFESNSRFLTNHFETPVITWNSTIEPRKGLLEFLDVVASLSKKGLIFEVIICGFSGWLMTPILKKLNSVREFSKINFLINQPRKILNDIYNQTDVFVYTSKGEGLGLPLFDFLHTKKLVVAKSSKIIDEMVLSAENLMVYHSTQELEYTLENIIINKLYLNSFSEPNLADTSWESHTNSLLHDFKRYL